MYQIYSLLFLALIIALISMIIFNVNYQKTEYYKQTHIPYFKLYFDKGHFGEYLTYKNLKSLPGYKHFLFNCYIPKDDGTTTEIDLILLHESGIYVFESKNYSGRIFGSEEQKQWTQTLSAAHKHSQKFHFLNPIIQNKTHIEWLQSYLQPLYSQPFYSYIVFSERCILQKITLTSNNHLVMKRNNIFQSVAARAAKADSLLTRKNIDIIYEKLYPLTQTDKTVKIAHIQNIQRKAADTAPSKMQTAKSSSRLLSDKICPKCGGNMILRTASKGTYAGKKFYGCSNYPKCRYIENTVYEK